MQEYHDDRMGEIKILSKFEPDKERLFKEMPTIEFYFHVAKLDEHNRKNEKS